MVAALFTLFELGQQRNFRTHAYDLGIAGQAIRGYAHLDAPVSLMKGVHNGLGTHFSVLGDHFSPIIALAAPAYRLFSHVSTLLVIQGLLFAASVPFVWLFADRKLGRPAAYVIAAAYSLAWGLQTAMANDFHEIAFAVPLLAVAIERLDAGKLRAALIAAAALLFVKEDYGLVVAAFGLVIGLRTKRWRLGAAVGAAGIAACVIAIKVLIPAFGGRAGYYWNYYAWMGPDPASALWHVIRHPLATLHFALTPDAKAQLLRWFFLPLGLASFGSSFVLLALPLLGELLLSSNPDNWLLSSHYAAAMMPILTLAAVDTIGKVGKALTGRRAIRPRARTTILRLGYAAGVFAVAVWSCTRMPLGEMAEPWFWQPTAYQQAQRAAVDVVPSGATVEASDRLAPHLVDRTNVMLLDATPRGAPWVVFDQGHYGFPLSVAEQEQRPGWLLSHGYEEVFSRLDVAVYHRVVPGPR